MIFFSKRKVLRFFSPVFVAAIVFVPAVLTAGPIEDPLGATFLNKGTEGSRQGEVQPNPESEQKGTVGSEQGELQPQTKTIPKLSGSLTETTELKSKALPLDSTYSPPRGSNNEPQDFNRDFNRGSANATLLQRIQNQNGAIQKNNTVSQINTQKNNAVLINQQNQLNKNNN